MDRPDLERTELPGPRRRNVPVDFASIGAVHEQAIPYTGPRRPRARRRTSARSASGLEGWQPVMPGALLLELGRYLQQQVLPRVRGCELNPDGEPIVAPVQRQRDRRAGIGGRHLRLVCPDES